MPEIKGKNAPKIPRFLLTHFLPTHVAEEITGDLLEEFHHAKRPHWQNQWWFWYQSLSVCTRFNMNYRNLMCLLLAAFALTGFFIMLLAIAFLAYGDEAAFSGDYWTSGALHRFFMEPLFWQSLDGRYFSHVKSPDLYINIPSMLWATACLATLWLIDKKYTLTLRTYIPLALLALLTPYVVGVLQFTLYEVPLKQSGPIIAYMWISVLYLLLPLCFKGLRLYRLQY